MERLKELISQLMEQFDHQAEPSEMLQTTQLLEAELRILASQPPKGRVRPTKIAVMMPSAAKISPAGVEAIAKVAPPGAEASAKAVPSVTEAQVKAAPLPTEPSVKASMAGTESPGRPAAPAVAATPPPSLPSYSNPGGGNPSVAATNGLAVNGAANGTSAVNGTAVSAGNPPRTREPERGVWPFDPLAEKPTDRFTLSQKSKEINDIIGGGVGSSLNDKLRPDIVDLRSALNDTPVRDLKKAIGVNDRYVFVNQLFRGDEAMYERSIKTINGFRILPEAEYWMERELKVKLGWDENRDVTRHFYQLVKRRFS
ncbi:MAG TPA: hypothetical protein VGR89_06020 [Puia sp.]|nr:hypothetical protein [Puia sp.]